MVTVTIEKPSPIIKKEGEDKHPSFYIGTGSRLLNLALSGDAWNGGWAGQRLINIVGDTTTGKTLLVCEAANQLYYYWGEAGRNIKCSYADVEAAFDFSLAKEFGMPLDWIEWVEPLTIQEFFSSLYKEVIESRNYDCYMKVLDSLDGISEDAEIARAKKLATGVKLETGTYGTQKPKEVSAGLRLISQSVKKENMIIFVISQVRHDIGNVSRVRSFTRSGGKALDHYASQIVWLAEKEPITKIITVRGTPRKHKVGKVVQVRVAKNRLGREGAIIDIDIIDRYGIDDVSTMLKWLDSWSLVEKKKESYVIGNYKGARETLVKKARTDMKLYSLIVNQTQKGWDEIERKLRPDRGKKYPGGRKYE